MGAAPHQRANCPSLLNRDGSPTSTRRSMALTDPMPTSLGSVDPRRVSNAGMVLSRSRMRASSRAMSSVESASH